MNIKFDQLLEASLAKAPSLGVSVIELLGQPDGSQPVEASSEHQLSTCLGA